MIHETSKLHKLNVVTAVRYKTLKERVLTLDYLLSIDIGLTNQERSDFVTMTLRDGYDKPSQSPVRWLSNASKRAVSFVVGTDSSTSRAIEVPERIINVDDCDFLSRLPGIVHRSPLLAEPATEVAEHARKYFLSTIKKEAQDLSKKIRKIQRDACKDHIARENQIDEQRQLEDLRAGILSVLRSSLESDAAR